MSSSRWSVALVAMVLAGCVGDGPVRAYSSPGEALQLAATEAEAGRWGEVLAILDRAGRQFPDDPAVTEQRVLQGERWQRERQRLEDELAVVRAEGLQDELALLEPLARAEPDRVLLSVQLGQRRDELDRLRGQLLQCAERQMGRSLELSGRCAALADRIASDERSVALARTVSEQAAAVAARAEAKESRSAETRRERLLRQADSRLAAGDYTGALQPVEEVLAEEPANARALAMRATLTRALERQVGALNELGARLYAEGQIDQAIRVWESSLQVTPAQPEIADRLERARRVQGKLEQLRDASAPLTGTDGTP